MYRIDGPHALPVLYRPTPAGPQPDGYFSEQNAQAGTPATVVDAEWVNMVQEEISNCITDEDKLNPILDKAKRDQLLGAIRRECQAIKGSSGGGALTPPLEYYTATRTYGNAVPMLVDSSIYIGASFTLPAGVWDIWGHTGFAISAFATAQMLGGCIGVGTAYQWVNGDTGLSTQMPFAQGGVPQLMQFYAGRAVVAFDVPTTCYMQGIFRNGAGGFSLFGFMAARRLGLPAGGIASIKQRTGRIVTPYTKPPQVI